MNETEFQEMAHYPFPYTNDQLQGILTKNIVDILFIAETKLDSSLVDTNFQVNSYHFWCADKTGKGGGIAVYLRSEIAGDRRPDFELKQLNIDNSKWLFWGAYKPPPMSCC